MAITYKVTERGEPGVAGGGTKKYYATIVITGENDIEDLIKAIEKISTASGADIRAVLYALVDVATTELANGNIVRLADMGSLRMSLRSEGLPTAEKVDSTAIKGSKILFTPGKRLKEMQQTLKFKKA